MKSQKANQLLEWISKAQRPAGAYEIGVLPGSVCWNDILAGIHPTDFSHSLSATRSLAPIFEAPVQRSAMEKLQQYFLLHSNGRYGPSVTI